MLPWLCESETPDHLLVLLTKTYTGTNKGNNKASYIISKANLKSIRIHLVPGSKMYTILFIDDET